jgi:hypothetical protein
MSNSELPDLRAFGTRLLLFSVPVLAYAAVIFVCDPFQFLGGPPVIPEDVKYRSASPLNPCLWKMAKFHRDPAPNVLLGDSRMLAVPAERVSQAAREPYSNMAYGGASLQECIETFWFATRQTRLRNVYFGVSFDMYNDYNLVDRTESYLSIAGNPALYFINRTVLQATVYSIYGAAFHKDLKLGATSLSRDVFWKYEINGPEMTRMFQNYIYPVKYYSRLVELGRYAKQHGIQLTFVIFPTHTDFQERFGAFGLEPQKSRMTEDLAAIAPVFDFDYPSGLTRDERNFTDPLHLARPAMDKVVDEIWGGHVQYARRR